MTDLFEPFEANGLRLQNRIALSPLTRTRADMAGKVGALQAEYYWYLVAAARANCCHCLTGG